MLNAIRKSVKTLPMKILVGLLLIGFAFWGIGDIFNFRISDRVAQVGDTEVPAQRFADALAREQSSLTQRTRQFVSFDAMREAGVDRQILAALARDAAFTEELNGLGISAPDEDVAEAVQMTPAFQGPGGQFSLQAYQLYLGQQRMTAAEFEDMNRNLLAQQILTETAVAGVDAPPGAAARMAAYQGEQRVLTTVTMTLDMAPDPGQPDEGALREFYDANEALFTEPERRDGEYLYVDAVVLSEALTPDEDGLREAYELEIEAYSVAETRTVEQISIPDQETAEAAMGRLVGGAVTFEELSAEHGVSGASLSLGRVRPGDLPEDAAAAVFSEEQPGIIGPVQLPAGWGVFRITEIHEGGTASFEDVRDQIARRLAAEAVAGIAPELANMIDELRSEGMSLPEIADRLQGEEGGAAVQHGIFAGLARNATLAGGADAEGLLARPDFLAEAFDALDGEERDLVELGDGGFALASVEQIVENHLKPLDELRERAVAAWQDAERLKALEAQAAEIATGLNAENSIWNAGEALGTVVLPHGPFTRLTPPHGLPAELVQRAFEGAESEGVFAASADGERVMVAQIATVTPLEPEQMAQASGELEAALVASLRGDVVEYFARAIETKHPAYVDPEVVDSVFMALGAVNTHGN